MFVSMNSGSASRPQQSGSSSDPFDRPPPDEVDLLAKGGEQAVMYVLQNPQRPTRYTRQAPMVLLDAERVEIQSATLYPNTVLVHVYDLKEGFTRANEVLAFGNDRVAVGGVFHAGVEIFGSEFTYGVYGVSAEVPRSATNHVYNCSIYLGQTELSQSEVAQVLHEMCMEWPAADYELLNHNCCSFSAEFCDLLDVGPLPPWINRFARLLHRGRTATKAIARTGQQASKMIQRQANNFAANAQPHVNNFMSFVTGRPVCDDASPTSSCGSPCAFPQSPGGFAPTPTGGVTRSLFPQPPNPFLQLLQRGQAGYPGAPGATPVGGPRRLIPPGPQMPGMVGTPSGAQYSPQQQGQPQLHLAPMLVTSPGVTHAAVPPSTPRLVATQAGVPSIRFP